MGRHWWRLGLLGGIWGCGGPTLCECKAEAQKADPDHAVMADCEELYAGKSYEEIEAALAGCGVE